MDSSGAVRYTSFGALLRKIVAGGSVIDGGRVRPCPEDFDAAFCERRAAATPLGGVIIISEPASEPGLDVVLSQNNG
jgi:hypothetical protein